jgi:hypothetical protein
MLQRTWYLIDVDAVADLRRAPRPDTDQLLDDVADRFGADAALSCAHTATATHIALVMAEHVGDSVTHAAALYHRDDLDRLLAGLNLLTAHLTQAVQRLAHHIDQHTIPDLAESPTDVTGRVAFSLARAAFNGERFAGHLKEAHTTLRQLATPPTG